MGWVGTALQVLSAAQSVKGFFDQQQAAKETKRANAAMMATAEEEARVLKEDAKIKAVKERALAASARSQQASLFLKSGVTLEGSPLLVMEDTTARGDENAANVITNAENQSKALINRTRASLQPVKRANFFSMAAGVGQGISGAYNSGKLEGYWGNNGAHTDASWSRFLGNN